MTDMSVPKLQKKVEISFKDGRIMENFIMTIYLNKFSANHSGTETIDEILNDANQQFIPAVHDDEKETFFILNIDSVFFVRELEETAEENKNPDLSVQFITGEKMDLAAYEELPEYRSRAIDFLNGDHSFLTFLKGKHKIYINKNKINKVEIL